MPYTYIIECADGTYYTGWAADLEKRLHAHNAGAGARYTKGRAPVKLVYAEWQTDQSAAQRREREIKRLTRAAKEKLIKELLKENVKGG